MGNRFITKSKSSEIPDSSSVLIDEYCQTFDFGQSMQSNTYQESAKKSLKDQLSSESKEKKTKFVIEDKSKDQEILTKNEENNKISLKSNRNDDIMSMNPLGLHFVDDQYLYTFWPQETSSTMRDFIEVHAIPMFDLKTRSKFSNYCIKHKWFNTALKFKSMWESVRLNPTRILCGIRSQFDVNILISDCFINSNGIIVRAYSITSMNENIAIKASNYFTSSLNSESLRNSLWHNDHLFELNQIIEPLEFKNDRCGDRYKKIDFEDQTDFCTTNNMNVLNNNYKHQREIKNSKKHFIFVSFPKNDTFNFNLINDHICTFKIVEDNVSQSTDHQLIVIKGSLKNISKLKEKINEYLNLKYYFSEELMEF